MTLDMKDGKWTVSTVLINGFRAAKSSDDPTKIKAQIMYSTDEDGFDTVPEWAPPEWLIRFVRALENHLNGTVSANALAAARQLPEAKRESFDAMGLRVLRDLVPNPEALDGVLRIFNPKLN
jgi:hypothetical protein